MSKTVVGTLVLNAQTGEPLEYMAVDRQIDAWADDTVLDIVTITEDILVATRVTGPSGMDAEDAAWVAVQYHDGGSEPLVTFTVDAGDTTYSVTGTPPENTDIEDRDVLHTDVIDLDRGLHHLTVGDHYRELKAQLEETS